MDLAARARWALQLALGRNDVDWQNWHHAASLLAGVLALELTTGIDQIALTRAIEVEAERHQRLPQRPPLPEVAGEKHIGDEDLLNVCATALHFGGAATTFVGLVVRTARLAGVTLKETERANLVRTIRSNLSAREVDRYLGGPREPPLDLPDTPEQALPFLEDRAVGQLEHIQPDQVYKGTRLAFVGELIHGVTHAHAVRQLYAVEPRLAKRPLNRLAEQVNAQQRLIEVRAGQEYDELNEPASLSFMDVLGQGFDDPEKLHFACAARVLYEAHGRPEHWERPLLRTLAALE